MSFVRTRSVRDKKFLIWNFMEELLDNYDNACRKGGSTIFEIADFKSTRLPILNMDETFIFETLKEYERSSALIKIQDGFVTLTSKGMSQAKKGRKDWNCVSWNGTTQIT
jgi:hypothetical protein